MDSFAVATNLKPYLFLDSKGSRGAMHHHDISLSHHHIYNQNYNHHEPERRPSCCASASIAKARGEDVSAGRSMVKAICVTTASRVASWKGDTK